MGFLVPPKSNLSGGGSQNSQLWWDYGTEHGVVEEGAAIVVQPQFHLTSNSVAFNSVSMPSTTPANVLDFATSQTAYPFSYDVLLWVRTFKGPELPGSVHRRLTNFCVQLVTLPDCHIGLSSLSRVWFQCRCHAGLQYHNFFEFQALDSCNGPSLQSLAVVWFG